VISINAVSLRSVGSSRSEARAAPPAWLLPMGVSLRFLCVFSAFSALKVYLNSENTEIRRGPQSYAIFSRMAAPKLFFVALLFVLIHSTVPAQKLIPHPISLANGKSFDLNLPENYEIKVAAQGLKRVRFMTMSPDNRLFVTDMYNKTDNYRGVV